METIKVSVDVNINFSESAKAFLISLLNAKPEQKTVQAVPTQSVPSVKAQEPAKSAQSVPAVPAHNIPASSAIKIDQVRKALAEKINDHRTTIKAKLEELGAPSVTKLDPSKYEEMYNFLIAL